jgi:hypothetical protein
MGEFVMLCRHCQRVRVNRPRGMCWRCYYTPGLRKRYPSTSKFARRGIADFIGRVKQPRAPTRALPGSPEKVAILEERARRHLELWHPRDAPLDRESQLLGVH